MAAAAKVKLCGATGNPTDTGHFCICTSADWHLAAGLKFHGCSCGQSWKSADEGGDQ